MKNRAFVLVLLGIFALSACRSEHGIPVWGINPGTVDHAYCQSPDVLLSISEAQGLSEDDIARRLMERWLDYFNTPQAPAYCRIDRYRIERVYYDERTPQLNLEPRSDLMRTIQVSLKLVQYPSFWAAWPGDVDELGWLHTGVTVAVFRSSEGYTMQFAHP